jgi:hypothetical protein
LLGHLEHDAVFGDRLQAAGIHHQIGALTDSAASVMAVTSQTRLVGDQRVTAARETIEQSGLAHIWTTYEYECGQHAKYFLNVM